MCSVFDVVFLYHVLLLPWKSVLVLFTVYVFLAPAHFLFSCVTVQIPPTQRETNAADDWRLYGKELSLALRAVARTVFVCPALAGVMEREFFIADMYLQARLARPHFVRGVALLASAV